MVKAATVLQPLQKITHARQYLKAQRTAASFDPTMVQQVFRNTSDADRAATKATIGGYKTGEGWGCGVEGEGGDGGGWRPIEAPTSIKANWRMRVAMLFIGKKYRVEGAWTKNVVEHVK